MKKKFPKDTLLEDVKKRKITIKEVLANVENETIEQYILISNTLLFGSENYLEEAEKISNIKFAVGACKKTIGPSDIMYYCETCTINDNALFCQNCYVKEHHEGHALKELNGCLGTCDCGDIEAMLPSDFCPAHPGYKEENLSESLLPDYFRESYPKVLKCMMKKLSFHLLVAIDAIQRKAEESLILINKITIVEILTNFNYLISLSPIFIKGLSYVLSLRGFCAIDHDCCEIVSENEEKLKKKIEKHQEKTSKKICTCTATQLIIQYSRFIPCEESRIISQFLIMLSQNPKFKIVLCDSYITNFQIIL